jgi:hypothetical protein
VYHSEKTREFCQENIPPFDEMIISWNGERRAENKIFARVKLEEWSPWFLYATWGNISQFSCQKKEGFVEVYQDILQITEGKKVSGFHIKTDQPLRLHVYTNSHAQPTAQNIDRPIFLEVPGLSQITLDHPRATSLCSPTSLTALLRYFSKKRVEPLQIAERVWDQGFDIFGNWVFNVAEGWTHLGPNWSAWVERLTGFSDIYRRLTLKTPVIVSVRGPLLGSAEAYEHGHLIVVSGFNPKTQEVHCMDPAFASDDGTHVCYHLEHFMAAWERRGKVAYIFEKA